MANVLADLAALGSFLSGIAVLISLIFLWWQLRQLNAQVAQGEKTQQAIIKQSRTERVMQVNARLTDGAFAKVIQRIGTNADDLTAQEVAQFAAHARTVFQNGEDSFAQNRRGVSAPDDYQAFVQALEWSMLGPAIRVSWRQHRGLYPADYVAFMDNILARTQARVIRPDVMLAEWRRAVAAESATAVETEDDAAERSPL